MLGALLVLTMVSAAAAQETKPADAKATANAADAVFQAIYKADAKWRRAQRGSDSPDEDERRLPPKHLERVDTATQAKALAHWQDVLAQLDKVAVKDLSADEHLNYEVYRAQIVTERNQQQFREYEKPANSDTQFWGGLAPGDGRGFRNLEQFERYLSRLNDVPLFFDENIANMRAGLARGFTPPHVTLIGRDKGLKDVANAKDAKTTAFWKPFEKMPASIEATQQEKLRTQAEDVITHKVMPAYRKLLAFWDDEYVPHAQTSIAAESLPMARLTTGHRFWSTRRSQVLPQRFTRLVSRRWRAFTRRCSRP